MKKLILSVAVVLMFTGIASAAVVDSSFEAMAGATWLGTAPNLYAYYSDIGDWTGGWTSLEGGYGVTNVPDGTYFGNVGSTPLYQDLTDTFVDGQTYTLTAMASKRNTGASGSDYDWRISIGDGTNLLASTAGDPCDVGTALVGGQWNLISVSYTATLADAGKNIQVYMDSPAGGFKYVVDDVQIPEPATICLLGLGGLLLRRKR